MNKKNTYCLITIGIAQLTKGRRCRGPLQNSFEYKICNWSCFTVVCFYSLVVLTKSESKCCFALIQNQNVMELGGGLFFLRIIRKITSERTIFRLLKSLNK